MILILKILIISRYFTMNTKQNKMDLAILEKIYRRYTVKGTFVLKEEKLNCK